MTETDNSTSRRPIGPASARVFDSRSRQWRSRTVPPRDSVDSSGTSGSRRTTSPSTVRQDKSKSRFFGNSGGPQTSTIVSFSDFTDKQANNSGNC